MRTLDPSDVRLPFGMLPTAAGVAATEVCPEVTLLSGASGNPSPSVTGDGTGSSQFGTGDGRDTSLFDSAGVRGSSHFSPDGRDPSLFDSAGVRGSSHFSPGYSSGSSLFDTRDDRPSFSYTRGECPSFSGTLAGLL
ncbi:UNVERIFIED_CONTAM: hypothetical protein FKN15_065439 [Acipenser sinensis]